jgi:hypothetical protein
MRQAPIQHSSRPTAVLGIGKTGPTLGSVRDDEQDGQPTANADGDDANGSVDDEDGVTLRTVARTRRIGCDYADSRRLRTILPQCLGRLRP